MTFSGGVKLGDLDDWLSPSSECIKPLIEAASGGGAFKIENTDARGPISAPQVEKVTVQQPNLIKTKKSKDSKAEIAGVTLSDCLACSGCVTSAETVLLQEQSGEEFLKRASTAPLTVVSISGEARSSLAAHFQVSPLLIMQKLVGTLSQLGVRYVLEGSASEALALLEGEAEFVKRYQRKGEDGKHRPMPLLTSHCPGWTCYAEKVVDASVLPHLVQLRPPQQIQGRLVKTCLLELHNHRRFHRWWRSRSPLFAAESWRWFHSQLDEGGIFADCKPLEPADVYHVSVQPCFDRKIEAARPHFTALDSEGVKEVDTVLTATELLELVTGAVADDSANDAPAVDVFDAMPSCSEDSEAFTDLFLGSLSTTSGTRPAPLLCAVHGANAGSGGFVEHIFRSAAAKLFTIPMESPLTFKTLRNEDMREVTLEDPKTKRVLLKFVSAYGFRNIQNVIRNLTKEGTDLSKECGHFVEIMACPGGCLNGAGLVVAPKVDGAAPSADDRRKRLENLENLLHSGEGVAVVPAIEHPLILPMYRYIHSRSAPSEPSRGSAKLVDLIGGPDVSSFLAADWRSLKVDTEGNAVLQSSALKW